MFLKETFLLYKWEIKFDIIMLDVGFENSILKLYLK